MTQEQKNLLLKDLCARLPYGVKISIPDLWTHKEEIETLDEIFKGDDGIYRVNSSGVCLKNIKPYLFPLSSMTKEQLKEMQKIIGNPNEAWVSVNSAGLELWLNSVDTDPTIWLDVLFELQDWLNKNHFDFRGLIEKGLAIDATGKNIY